MNTTCSPGPHLTGNTVEKHSEKNHRDDQKHRAISMLGKVMTGRKYAICL